MADQDVIFVQGQPLTAAELNQNNADLTSDIVQDVNAEAIARNTAVQAEVTRAEAAESAETTRAENAETLIQAGLGAIVQPINGSLQTGLVVTDPAGDLLMQVTPQRLRHPQIDLISGQAAAGALAAASVAPVPASPSSGLVITDAAQNILVEIESQTIRHPQIDTINNEIAALQNGVTQDWSSISALAETVHLICYGQSLSIGQLGTPPLTTGPLAYAQKFSPGVRYEDANSDDPSVVYASLAPYAETAATVHASPGDGGYPAGETPLGGCIQMIHDLLLAENGIDLASDNQTLLGSALGHSGEPISYLAVAPYFPRIGTATQYGQARVNAGGKTYSPGAMIWLQGEADAYNGVDQPTYTAALRNMRGAAEASVQAASGLMRPYPLLTYQTSTHIANNEPVPSIALAQLSLVGDKFITMASPTYFLPYSDGLHLTATGYKWLGAYFGLSLKRWLWDGVKPFPLMLKAATRLGTSVIVSTTVAANRHLVLDTTSVADPGNHGFTLVDNTGAAMTISSVQLVGRDKVKITASAAIPAGAQLRYAWIGDSSKGVGCIRDNSGDTLVFDPNGINKPMHNWLPICSIGIN